MIIFLFWVLFAAMAGLWAKKQGKSFLAWTGLAIVATPLLAFVVLGLEDLAKARREGPLALRAGFTEWRSDWRTAMTTCPACQGSGSDQTGKWCRLCRGQKQVTGDMADRFWTEFEKQMLKA